MGVITMGKHRWVAPAVVGAAAACVVGISGGIAQAAATTTHEHTSFPAAGAVFTCLGGNLTATAGTVDQVLATTVDGQGVFHMTGTITTHGVVLQDAAGNTYTLSGASWFGGKGTETDILVETDTADFVIHNSTGGVFAKVQAVEHLSPNGTVKSFDFGSCEAPAD